MTVLTGFDLCRAALTVADTTAPEQSVLLVLAVMADKVGQCWPGVATLVAKTKLGERTIRRALHGLRDRGHITIVEVAGKGNRYTIHPCRCGTPASESSCQSGTPATQTATPAAVAPKLPVTTIPKKATPSREARAKPRRLPADWKPIRFADETMARAVIDRRGAEWGRAALESFKAWAANAEDKDGKGRKLDWQSAWAKWVIKQDSDDGRRNGTAPQQSASGHGRTVDAAQRVLARRGYQGLNAI